MQRADVGAWRLGCRANQSVGQVRESTELGQSRTLPSTVRSSVVAKEYHGDEQGDDDRVEGECDKRVTGDNSASQGCFDDDV
jgi:hypothetical protein